MQIKLNDLKMTYPSGKCALNEVNLSLESPNMVGLLGPNGAGKSTLMKLLVSSIIPTQGEILIDDKNLRKCEKEMKRQLGYLPQSFGLYDELSVVGFLDYMASLKQIANRKEAIEKALLATNLKPFMKTKIHNLSGGQAQRVGIAQAILGDPKFLIFDEPTVGLDPEERIHFRNYFSKTAQDKLVILSTHIIEDVQAVCNQLVVLNHGKILFHGTPEEMIVAASGHVGTFYDDNTYAHSDELKVTSRINTSKGILCRVVAKELPNYVTSCEPNLEDAYLYLIETEGGKL